MSIQTLHMALGTGDRSNSDENEGVAQLVAFLFMCFGRKQRVSYDKRLPCLVSDVGKCSSVCWAAYAFLQIVVAQVQVYILFLF